MENEIASLNERLAAAGMTPVALVDPKELRPAGVNARYMDQQTMDNLVNNIKGDGALESVPLVYRADSGALVIVSGHHRVDAAIKAGFEQIMVMITAETDASRITAKQLSHNSITGQDDKATLKKLYDGIVELEARYYSGLQDEMVGLALQSLNFRAGTFRVFCVAFIDEDIVDFDRAVEEIEASTMASPDAVRLESSKAFQAFSDAIVKTKKVENIKSNASALARMAELALLRLSDEEASDG